ncbi:MAG TPA: DUF305 domain-containing protein [Rhizobiaceae bacterium]|nr:DUF305 domain-containing protein [Rhizobiaceae bacterium]
MRNLLTVVVLLGALAPAAAQHQHHGGTEAPAIASALPEACRANVPEGMASSHETMDSSAMNAHQQANMAGMAQMDRDMMAGMMQEDADMAFMCGMIAHHQGAIAMAETVLQHGDDAEAKALAQRIIDAQKAEIAEMTGWVARNAE